MMRTTALYDKARIVLVTRIGSNRKPACALMADRFDPNGRHLIYAHSIVNTTVVPEPGTSGLCLRLLVVANSLIYRATVIRS